MISIKAYHFDMKTKVRNTNEINEGKKMNEQRELPQYKSHKKVWAIKIKTVIYDVELAKHENRETDGSATITPVDDGYAPFKVDYDYVKKHEPTDGGYYVLYEGGYKSFSPADAFESGYSLI